MLRFLVDGYLEVRRLRLIQRGFAGIERIEELAAADFVSLAQVHQLVL